MDKQVAKAANREFGSWIRDLREAKGLLQKDVAEFINIGSSYYAKFERGEREPSWIQAMSICEYLGADINEFMRKYQFIVRNTQP